MKSNPVSTRLDSPPNVLPLKLGHRTDPGRSGKHNEDAYDIFQAAVPLGDDTSVTYPAYVAVIADGIGGNRGGERASRLAIDTIRKVITHERSLPVIGLMNHAVLLGNQEIYKHSVANPSLRGMGTTIVVAVIVEHQLYVAHAGDSRAYLIRDNAILPLTLDHTWVQEAIDAGRLTHDAAHNHPNRNVIKRYLGIQRAIDVDQSILDITEDQTAAVHKTVSSMPLLAGDTLVFCTDGLTDLVPDHDILRLVTQYEPEVAAEQMVDLANKRGGTDNITVVVAELPGGKAKAVAVPFWRRLLTIGLSLAIGLGLVGFVLSQVFGQSVAEEPPAASISEPEIGVTGTPPPPAEGSNSVSDRLTPTPSETEVTPDVSNEVVVPAVATITPFSTSTPVPNFTATATPIPTNTPLPPTRTPSPRPIPPTATREIVIPTNVPPVPTTPPQPTDVPVPATATPRPEPTQAPVPTTAPPVPTEPPPAPTDVPPAPTEEPPPEPTDVPPEPTQPPEPTPRPTPPPI